MDTVKPLEDDIARLGRLTVENKRDLPTRMELARLVGEKVVGLTPLTFAAVGRPKVFDLFMYNGERTVLDIRLHEMNDWVDHFVVIESGTTFTRLPKRYYFAEIADELGPYRDKIIHLVVDDPPAYLTSPWAVEFWQRDSALRALSGLCSPDDFVLLTDVDEIVDRRAFESLSGDLAGLTMDTYFLFLNRRQVVAPNKQGKRGAICRAHLLARHGMSYIRFVLSRGVGIQRIRDAGWHFTSVAAAAEVERKIQSYAHQELNDGSRNEAYFERKRRTALANADPEWERCALDELPRYIRDNANLLRDFLM